MPPIQSPSQSADVRDAERLAALRGELKVSWGEFRKEVSELTGLASSHGDSWAMMPFRLAFGVPLFVGLCYGLYLAL